MISGILHINLLVPPGTLNHAQVFYGDTLGLTPRAVPVHMNGRLAWFDIGSSGQQVHVAIGTNEPASSRHPCFRVESKEKLAKLRERVWESHVKGGEAAPREADKPGQGIRGDQSAEFPTRFFCRDFAGNRLEFSI
nr:hypothetical protein B0A51_13022 [Rachicladosporium sp. CCFEE 5018]